MPAARPVTAPLALLCVLSAVSLEGGTALAQMGPGGPPAVGIEVAASQEIVETTAFNGRIEAVDKVELLPRVTAYLDQRLFTEGAEVKKGQLMYRLERAPFEADVEAKTAAVAQAEAALENADLTLARAEQLLKTSTGSVSNRDNAVAAQRAAAAAVRAAKAQLWQAEINLGYTEIRSPIDGRAGRTSVAPGNVVGPATGALATVVSQDPIHVTFPMPMRRFLELRTQISRAEGLSTLRLRLKRADGRLYDAVGQVELFDIQVARDTDTIILRGIIANPVRANGERELTHDELVRIILESGRPRQVLAVPRSAILTDQLGTYVFVVGPNNIAQQRRVKIGQSTPETAAILEGVVPGDRVVVEGVQKVRPGAPVVPGPPAAKRS